LFQRQARILPNPMLCGRGFRRTETQPQKEGQTESCFKFLSHQKFFVNQIKSKSLVYVGFAVA